MHDPASIVERRPTIAEYLELVAAVGWRRREAAAVEIALSHSLYAVCALSASRVVGCGRVIGDGGLHFYLTDVIVHPSHQRLGIGTAIVEALTRHVEAVPFTNTLVEMLPTRGLADFYGRHGFKPQGPHCPSMVRWLNPSEQ